MCAYVKELHHDMASLCFQCSAANYRDEKCKEFSENISQQINLSSRRAIRTRYHHRNTTEVNDLCSYDFYRKEEALYNLTSGSRVSFWFFG